MLNFLPNWLVGSISSLLMGLNILFWVTILFAFSIMKFLLPPLRGRFNRVITKIAESWIRGNGLWIRLAQRIKWDVRGLEGLRYKSWYLIISNHQSWVDIFVLQKFLNRRIPLMKFFLKRELIWVPFMGLAWWALDFPFLRRYSVEYVKRHPEMKGKDLETTRKACEKFSHMPTSVMNFLEGTRFTRKRHAKQKSPYRFLLRPKAGGMALALNALGDKFHSLLNVSIVYPDGIPTFWSLLCGRVRRVIVRVQKIEIPQHFIHGDYEGDQEFRSSFQAWVQQLWHEKDAQIKKLLEEAVQKAHLRSDLVSSANT
jgi:1-acyl-sn-glycerol-3-phosphate acyltransferase